MQLKKLLIRPIRFLGLLATIAYPVAVFLALRHGFSVRMLGMILICVALIGVAQSKNLWVGICGILLAILSFVSNYDIFLKLYPVFMNAGVCAIFALSLRGVPLIQRFAEKMHCEINKYMANYARGATIAWTVFLAINTLVSLVTVFMPDIVWTVYNGLISYCLIALMMLVEYVVRTRVRANAKNR